MKYRIEHKTAYTYQGEVGLCQNEARLQPRSFVRQKCAYSRLEIAPLPLDYREREDFFGNRVAYFSIQQPHEQLAVTAVSEVEVIPPGAACLALPLSWEAAYEHLHGEQSDAAVLDARQFLLDSPMVVAGGELADYADNSFLPGRPLVAAVQDLMQRIYRDFVYDPEFTTVATPLSEVLEHRRGVCQDFAHLAIGCLRTQGLAARYVSGYIETLPAKGEERLTGADASHAWFSVYVPGYGWLDFDPTNNQLPQEQHVTLAWGRDYSDVTPLKGVAFGGGEHRLTVSVDVKRI